MYFIGVTTARSSIHRVFPRWAEQLGLGACELRGVDFPLHDRPEHYRAVVEHIATDPLSLGALVTTHKVDLFHACADQFDAIEPLSRSLGEISSVYKRGGRLYARSVDPWAAGEALESFLPGARWPDEAEALILGAGGAGTALAWHLSGGPGAPPDARRPRRVLVVDQRAERLAHAQRLHASWPAAVPLSAHRVEHAHQADALLARLPPHSLVVNATGAGKDTPGSPVSDAARFPLQGFAWDFNYRGELAFLAQARAQASSRGLHVEDGWTYFLQGWLRVIADVFAREVPLRGAGFDALRRTAEVAR